MTEQTEKKQSEKLVALVTGGNKGLGLEIVKQLAERGYTVLLAAREDKAKGPAKKLEAAGSGCASCNAGRDEREGN